jgi:hypothetical protein
VDRVCAGPRGGDAALLLLRRAASRPVFQQVTTARPHSYFPHHSTPSLLLPSPQYAVVTPPSFSYDVLHPDQCFDR